MICLPFAKLTVEQLYDMLRLRSEVFVVEQNCIYQDLDNKDRHENAYHLLEYQSYGDTNVAPRLVAYARLLPAGLSYPSPSIGRIVSCPANRNIGLGKVIVAQAIAETHRLWPAMPITIGAQSHLSDFYKNFGFVEISESYLEDGIPHVDMQLPSNYAP